MDGIITIDDMNLVYQVTDDMGIDREIVRVELSKEDPGSVIRGEAGMLGASAVATFEIVLPLTTSLEEWLPVLRAEIERVG